MNRVLATSTGVNAVLAGALGYLLRRRLLASARRVSGGRTAPRKDFAAVAAERFDGWSGASVALVGDSQFELAPAADLLGAPVRTRAIGGALVADVLEWIDGVLADRPSRVVLFIGSNDAYFRARPRSTSAAAAELFARLAAAGCEVGVVTVPPVVGRDAEVARINGELTALADEHGFAVVDLHAALAGTDWTVDGLHLDRAAYGVLAGLLAPLVG